MDSNRFSSTVDDNLAWKIAQKNDTKNKTSDTINRIIPHRNPFVTIFVCSPSRVTSRHHLIMVSTVIIVPITNNLSYWWNHLISPIKVTIAPIAPVRGHGHLFTMWNGWFSCIDIDMPVVTETKLKTTQDIPFSGQIRKEHSQNTTRKHYHSAILPGFWELTSCA